ncbi:MAG: hypothetical protein LC650_02620 [Actinobacteria bacterium]|nr:hypothetical protein [Actinomycetota bacterium]
MGFNTVALLYNDHFHEIEKDPLAGRKLVTAALQADREGHAERRGNLVLGARVPGIGEVLPPVHADGNQILSAGGNMMSLLGVGYGSNAINDEGAVNLLKQVAKRYGYRLVKAP